MLGLGELKLDILDVWLHVQHCICVYEREKWKSRHL